MKFLQNAVISLLIVSEMFKLLIWLWFLIKIDAKTLDVATRSNELFLWFYYYYWFFFWFVVCSFFVSFRKRWCHSNWMTKSWNLCHPLEKWLCAACILCNNFEKKISIHLNGIRMRLPKDFTIVETYFIFSSPR